METAVRTVRAPTWALVLVALALGACATREPAQDATSATAAPPPTSAAGSGATTAGTSSAAPGARDVSPSASSASSGAATDARAAGAPRESSVYFEFDSSTLSDEARRVVQQHADFLANRREPIRLEGNADERGSREYNLALGQRRAESVRQVLTLRGLPGDAVETVSYGEERPRCTEDTEDCYAANRRVDFIYRR